MLFDKKKIIWTDKQVLRQRMIVVKTDCYKYVIIFTVAN